jgi:hypothetical protein
MKILKKIPTINTEVIFLILIILPFLAISIFNQPTDDDFLFAKSFQGLGWSGIPYLYKAWTGRYTSLILYCVLFYTENLSLVLALIKLAPIIYILCTILALYFMIDSFLPNTNRKHLTLVSLYVFCVYLYGVPSVTFAFYWYSGASVYTSGQIFLFLTIGSVNRYFASVSKLGQYAWQVITVSFLVLLIGCNEIFIPIVLIYLGYLFFVIREHRKIILFWLCITIVASLVAIMAPGNFVRANQIDNIGFSLIKVVTTVMKSNLLSISHIFKWASSPILWLVSFVMLTILGKYTTYMNSYKRNGNKHIIVYVVLYYLTTSLIAAMSIWVSNDVPTRIWNTEYVLFLLFWFFCVFNLLIWYHSEDRLQEVFTNTKAMVKVGFFFIIFLSGSSSVYQAYIDLFFKANAYSKASNSRYQVLVAAHEGKLKRIDLPPLVEHEYNYPKTIYIHDIEKNPKDIGNAGLSSLFSVDSVYIKYKADPIRTYFKE